MLSEMVSSKIHVENFGKLEIVIAFAILILMKQVFMYHVAVDFHIWNTI